MSKRKIKILTRHNAAPLNEFLYYARSVPMRHLCRTLGRHERTVKDWMGGKAVIPPWAIAVLRLQALEHELIRDQMGFTEIEREAAQPRGIPRRFLIPPANDQFCAVQLQLDIQSAATESRPRPDSTYAHGGK
ncbi:hypothetical protein PQQ52_11425 [Paraburkholderia sediminicola]|uniref:hypothetical protein n=1 Tax=Paraburkholderia sediminicola TaxID=458836 RepID=UPI0038BD554E